MMKKYTYIVNILSIIFLVHSHLSETLATLHSKVTGCDWETASVLSVLAQQVKKMQLLACTPRSCSVEYARMCLMHAEEMELVVNRTEEETRTACQ